MGLDAAISTYWMGSNPIENVWIKTTSGISKVKQINLTRENDILLIRKDSMMSNLDLNPLGDSVQFLFWYKGSYVEETPYFIFGNMHKVKTRSPKPGQSIALIDQIY